MDNNNKIHHKYSQEFVNKWWKMIQSFLEDTLQGNEPITNIQLPDQLGKLVDFDVTEEPVSEETLMEETLKALKYQAKPYHPHFHNQLFGGFDQYSFAGALAIPAINGSIYTYEMAPCFTLMENSIWEHMRKVIGWEEIDGTMTPGGSFANFYAIHQARFREFPDVVKKGMIGLPPLKIFSSDCSHYSLRKGANLTGIGIDNVVKVPTDSVGRMIPAELEAKIKQEIENGSKPLMVNLTLGTTVEGVIDDIPALSDVCEKYGVWCHVDGALGGALLMSPALRKPLGSFAKVDSITFDPHKALVAPLQASFFLCKHRDMAKKCNSLQADYLFHKERASYKTTDLDVGDKQLMCGRTIDILKLWTYFKGNGWKGIA